MGVETTLRKLTFEDYLGFPEDGRRHELLDGDHVAEPAPNTVHQRISSNLHRVLSTFVHQHHLGWVLTAPCDVVLSDVDVVEPDLLYLSAAHGERFTRANIQGAPDLVVEILSESTRRRDELTKRHLYERHGVPEYWIVDPELETVKVYRLAGGRYARAAELAAEAGDRLVTPLLDGLSIEVREIFEYASGPQGPLGLGSR
jgi:Uma2 family endonuclease